MTDRVGDLELGGKQETEPYWTWQRIGWGAIGVVLLAAVIGVFGGGPVASASARSADGTLAIEYERLTRLLSPSTLRVTAAPAATAEGRIEVHINRDYFHGADLDHVTPQPKETRVGPDDLAFTFDAQPGQQAEVAFQFRANAAGARRLQVRLADGPPLDVRQFVYPQEAPMDAVLRGFVIYTFLLLLFRIAGKRSVAQTTTFDFVLLLVIGEATQQALLSDDYSVTNALLLIATLIGIDILVSLLASRYPRLGRIVNGAPVVIMEDGRLLRDRMRKARVEESDILTAAREAHGIERLDQIKYAVLERSGGVSIVPRAEAK